MMSKVKVKRSGFTLVELMISLFLILTIGSIIFSIYVTSLRGSKKTISTATIRESGNFAITRLVREIQFAKDVVPCIDEPKSELTILSQKNESIRFVCIESSDYIRIENNTIPTPEVSFLFGNSGAANKVAIEECSYVFACIDSTPKQVKIRFILSDNSTSTLSENKVTIPFETTVTLRNTAQ